VGVAVLRFLVADCLAASLHFVVKISARPLRETLNDSAAKGFGV